MTEYRDIDGYDGYRVGSDGTVWSRRRRCRGGGLGKRWHELRGWRCGNGYRHVHLADGDGGCRTEKVHRLVLAAFAGPCPPGMECRHLNGTRDDNRAKNLAWGTRRENCDDTIRHGRTPRGERSGKAKLTAALVREVRRRAGAGETRRSIAGSLGLAPSTVTSAVNGDTWRDA